MAPWNFTFPQKKNIQDFFPPGAPDNRESPVKWPFYSFTFAFNFFLEAKKKNTFFPFTVSNESFPLSPTTKGGFHDSNPKEEKARNFHHRFPIHLINFPLLLLIFSVPHAISESVLRFYLYTERRMLPRTIPMIVPPPSRRNIVVRS